MNRNNRIKLNDADEYDAFTGWRKWYTWKAGRLKAIKRGYNRRVRKLWKVKLNEHSE